MDVKFDPAYPLSYGFYQCSRCGREWYDTFPFHLPGCGSEAIYVFGPKEDVGFTPVGLRDQVSQILSKEVKSEAT